MTFQQVIIVGNVGKDGDLQYTAQGVAVLNFSVAVNKVTGKGENRKEKTTWFRVAVWRERAESLANYIKKGTRVLVVGEVSIRTYTDRDGKSGASLDVDASDVKLLDSAPNTEREAVAGASGNNAGEFPF